MSDIKVSIITPNYNYGHLLGRTLSSVADQDYSNIEHFVVDGGSNDDSVDVIKAHAAKGHLANWVSESDKGQTDAINKGFAMTTGDIFAWLNADDYYAHSGVISQVVDLYEKGNRFISGEFRAIDADGNEFPEGAAFGKCNPIEFKDALRFWANHCPPQPATFVDRILAANVFPLDISVECYMDYQLFLGILAENPKTAWIPEVWVDFVYHGENKSMGNFSDAYNWEAEARRVFLGAAEKLPASDRAVYQKEFEKVALLQNAGSRPALESIQTAFRQSPGTLANPRFWKILLGQKRK
ncbi:MAG: glycosyltransferase family 2 protein [Verrucomicrobiota bacterium]